MRLSQESEYGLEGVKVLAGQPDGRIMLLRNIAALGGLREILEAIEGRDILAQCFFWPFRCDQGRPCSLNGQRQ
jgi:hypothetical protein